MDELRAALELATEEELEHLTQILFCRRFNPLDYLTPEPIIIQSQDRESWLTTIEQRFRYLAADSLTVLRGKSQEVSYRQALIQVCHYLKIRYSQKMATTDIEAEVFLHLIGKTWKKLPVAEQTSIITKVQNSIAESKLPEPLPVQWQKDPLNFILKGSGIIALSSVVKPWLLKQIAKQLAIHLATYQTARAALIKGGAVAATQIQNVIILQSAKQGMATTAARYGATRSLLAFVGPVLWGCLVAELGWKAIATNYGRIIPVIFALAQIRLTRSECLA